jgi:ribosomal protein L11 methyltransferase
MAALTALVATVAGEQAAAALRLEPVPAQDWVRASLAGLAPVVAGRFVVYGSHDRARRPRGIGIEIEAALAFGTGHHGTTRGCLLALDRLLKRGRPARVLDVGTGSGVLAIAAAKAARCPVAASEIDPQAARAARANARANGAGALVRVTQAGRLDTPALAGRYELAFANILLRPLLLLAVPLARKCAPGGALVLSGLLPAQANAALAAYRAQGLVLRRRLDLEGWTTLVLARPAAARRTRLPGA